MTVREGDEAEFGAGTARKAANSAVYLGLAQIVRLVLTILSAVIIARILSPDDYGVVAMAAPVLGFLAMLQDLGLGAAAVQSRSLSDEESTGIFWVNMAAALLAALAMVAVSPAVALFYGDPRAGYVTAAAGVGALITGLGLQHGAILNRDMRFAVLSGLDIANALCAFLVSVAFALWLKSYWALIFGAVAGAGVQAALSWRAVGWRPSGGITFAAARRFGKFGGHVTGFNIVNYVVRNADNVLIAKLSGPASLGLYDRSYKLMMMPLQTLNGPINRLLFPMLSRMQDDPVRYRQTFVFAIRALSLASIPGIAVAVALSDHLMVFLLGERWKAAGPIFFWLGLAGLFQPLGNLTGLLFMTSGRTGAMLRWGVFSAIVTLIGFVIGVFWGPQGVAASFFISAVLRTPLLFFYSTLKSAVRPIDLFAAQFEPLLAAGVAILAVLWLRPMLPIGPLLCVAIPLTYTVVFVAALATAGGRDCVFALLRLGRGVLSDLANRLRSIRVRRRTV